MGKVIWGHIIMAVGAFIIAYWPKVFPVTGNEMGYCILAYCLIFPLITLVSCFLCSLRGILYGLTCTFFSAIAALLIPYPVFGGLWRENVLLPTVGAIIGVALSTVAERVIKHKQVDYDDTHLNP